MKQSRRGSKASRPYSRQDRSSRKAITESKKRKFERIKRIKTIKQSISSFRKKETALRKALEAESREKEILRINLRLEGVLKQIKIFEDQLAQLI